MLEGHSKTLFLSLSKKNKKKTISSLTSALSEPRRNTQTQYCPGFSSIQGQIRGRSSSGGGGGGESHLGVIGVHLHLLREQNVPQLLI